MGNAEKRPVLPTKRARVVYSVHCAALAVRADSYSFTVTHLPDTLRVTRPLSECHREDRREAIWVFGCSFTHGWSLNDEETYPWVLQQRLPDYQVVNFGVSGYGTLHSLMQFREALRTRDKPKAAVVAYGFLHDRRNTFLRARRLDSLAWPMLP